MSAKRLPVWLQLLAVEYPATKRTVDQQELLVAIYAEEDEELLRRAAIRYLKSEEFYPSVSTFRPYVRYEHEVRPYVEARASWPSDEELLLFEQDRGTMPPDKELHASYWSVVLLAAGVNLEESHDEPTG